MKFSPGLQSNFIREILAVKKKDRKIRNIDGILYLTPSGQITNVLADGDQLKGVNAPVYVVNSFKIDTGLSLIC